jgi:hypothetical protein
MDWRYPFRQVIFTPKGSDQKRRRGFVYLPREVIESLKIDAGDCVTFVVSPKASYVVLTNIRNAPDQVKSLGGDSGDPKLMVANLQAELVEIDSREDTIEEAWRNQAIQDSEYMEEKRRIRHRIDEIKSGLQKIYSTSYYRGDGPDVDEIESAQIVAFAADYAESVTSMVAGLLSDIERYRKRLESLHSSPDEHPLEREANERARGLTEARLKVLEDAMDTISQLVNERQKVDPLS